MKKNLLVYLQGGTGYHAAFAQILPEAKKYYDKIYVCSAYADIFKQNPYVEYVYNPEDGAAAFQDLDIDDTYIAAGRVYDYDEFIHKDINYSDAFRRWIGIPEKHEDLSTTKIEVKDNEQFQNLSDQIEDHIFHKLKDKKYKNFILMQTTGGQSPLSDTNQPYDNRQQPLRRYMSPELAQQFISLFKKLTFSPLKKESKSLSSLTSIIEEIACPNKFENSFIFLPSRVSLLNSRYNSGIACFLPLQIRRILSSISFGERWSQITSPDLLI